jgi:hypothetical protein
VRRKLRGATLLSRIVLSAVALSGVVLMAAGCANPPGVDGNLTNNWPKLTEAKVPVPAEKVCYQVSTDNPPDVTKWPPSVKCTESHTVETVHVGAFTGDDASRTSTPPTGGPGRRKAYEDCAASAKTFLGDDWRVGRDELFLSVPTDTQWEAGARYYRCDLVEYKDLDTFEIVNRTSSMEGVLGGSKALGLFCFAATEKNGSVDTMTATDCTAAHNSEFTGVWDAPDQAFPDDATARRNLEFGGCKTVTAAYTGIPNDSNFQYRTGQITFPFTKGDWDLGNRGVRCYMLLNKNVNRSMKGAGTAGLPINTG